MTDFCFSEEIVVRPFGPVDFTSQLRSHRRTSSVCRGRSPPLPGSGGGDALWAADPRSKRSICISAPRGSDFAGLCSVPSCPAPGFLADHVRPRPSSSAPPDSEDLRFTPVAEPAGCHLWSCVPLQLSLDPHRPLSQTRPLREWISPPPPPSFLVPSLLLLFWEAFPFTAASRPLLRRLPDPGHFAEHVG